jgi:hypothetical protein
MNGLRGAHAERVNPYGRPLQVAFTALLLTITGADGCALAAVVVPSEDHKWTLASVLALYGVDVSQDDLWQALPRVSQEDVPCFQFIYRQVPAICHPACRSLRSTRWTTLTGLRRAGVRWRPVLQCAAQGLGLGQHRL